MILCSNYYTMEGQELIARDAHFQKILEDLIGKNPIKSLYICGKPGTGKTFTLDKVIEQIRRRKNLVSKFSKIVELNGMEISTSSDIWKIIHNFLVLKKKKSKSFELSVLKYFSGLTKPLILLIDEFENLITKVNRELIIELFSLPFTYENLILVSISNLVDLPDILMPQLERRGCIPEILLFEPYNKQELLEIIKDRYGDVSEAIALEICAAQVEKIGDARRALGICKNSLKNGSISLTSTMKTTTNWHSAVKVLGSLPYLNKGALVICKNLSENKMNLLQMHTSYRSVCCKEGGEGLPLNEFIDMLQNLASSGLVEFEGKGKDITKRHTKIVVSWEELEKAFKDLPEILDLRSAQVASSWKSSI